MKRAIFLIAFLFTANFFFGQEKDLPLKIEKSDSSEYLVLYISGDGGRGLFDAHLSKKLIAHHFSVIYLNSFKYFKPRKPPEQLAGDMIPVLMDYQKKWDQDKIVLIGYSFGGDVMPFLYTRLPDDLKQKVVLVVLLTPSSTTDFRIHFSDMLGIDHEYEWNVVKEVEKINMTKVLAIFGVKEHSTFPADYNQENFEVMYKKGHHRFTDSDYVMESILKELE